MNRRHGVACGIASMLFLPSPAHADLIVKSHNARQYWIIRTDVLNHLRGNSHAQRLDLVEARYSPYGPHDVDSTDHPTKADAQYSVFPRCGNRMKREPVRPYGRLAYVWADC